MKKILIVKLSSLGDIMVSTPFIELLKNNGHEVHHLVMKHCQSVTDENPYLDKQLVIETLPTGNFFKDLFSIFNIFFKIKKENYDISFILHRNFFLQVICFCAGIKEIYGFTSKFNIFYKGHIKYKFDINRTLQEYKLIKLSNLYIDYPTSLKFYTNKILSNNILNMLPKIFIACNPGGGNIHAPADNRTWPIAYYADLINRIDIPFVILGYGDSDLLRVNELIKICGSEKIINLVNKTTYSESSLILKRSICYLGNDSALLFLAAAVGAKSLGIYGPTQVVAAKPLGDNCIGIVSTADCAPCYNPYDGIDGVMYSCKNNICMQSISVSSVELKIKEIISL